MENSFYKTYNLVQQTPIIHFQSNEKGATVRTSELKPKLDKYLFSKMSDEPNSSWLVGKGQSQHKALDYKILVKDKDKNPQKGSVIIIPPDSKNHIFSKELELKIFCLYDELHEFIKAHLSSFFLTHNFGLRQNKGWGGYLLEGTTNIESLLLATGKTVFKRSGNSNINNFYRDIMDSWHILKSGKNYNGYIKSHLFKYMCSQGIRWEKRYIKQELKRKIISGVLPQPLEAKNPPVDCFQGEVGCGQDNQNYSNWTDNPKLNYDFRFVRALLGMPEHHEYRAKGNYIYQVSFHASGNIERIKAPVTFKFLQNSIYAIVEDLDMTSLRNAPFEVKVLKKRNKIAEGRPITLINNLELPQAFDLNDFLETYFPCVNFQKLSAP